MITIRIKQVVVKYHFHQIRHLIVIRIRIGVCQTNWDTAFPHPHFIPIIHAITICIRVKWITVMIFIDINNTITISVWIIRISPNQDFIRIRQTILIAVQIGNHWIKTMLRAKSYLHPIGKSILIAIRA